LEDGLRFFAIDAQYVFVALLAVLFLVRGKWRSVNGRHGVAAAGFSALLALGIAQLVADLWARPRPYVAPPDVHLVSAPLGPRAASRRGRLGRPGIRRRRGRSARTCAFRESLLVWSPCT
jgi:hypothetical protein